MMMQMRERESERAAWMRRHRVSVCARGLSSATLGSEFTQQTGISPKQNHTKTDMQLSKGAECEAYPIRLSKASSHLLPGGLANINVMKTEAPRPVSPSHASFLPVPARSSQCQPWFSFLPVPTESRSLFAFYYSVTGMNV